MADDSAPDLTGGSHPYLPSSPDDQAKMPDEVPLLPVKNMVAFPGTIVPLTVAREKSQRLLDAVLIGDKLIAVVAQRNDRIEDPQINDIYRIGTVCRVLKMLKMPDNTDSIILHGVCRVGIEELTQSQPFWKAKIHAAFDSPEITPEINALMHDIRDVAAKVIEHSPNVPDEAQMILNNIEEPGKLADFLAANISLGLIHRQELLETFDVKGRLIKVDAALRSHLEVLELSDKLQSRVRDQIDEHQREYYLREQLKAIRTELGQDESRSGEIQKLELKIKQAKMPAPVETEAIHELERLNNISQGSPEYSVAHDYIEWLCELPWSIHTDDRLDIRKAKKILDEDHYGLAKVKRRILEFLAVRKLKPTGKGPILCFVGPPGTGKTSLGRSIARAMGRNFIRMSVGGVRDEADIRGHRRTYIGSMPGRIIQEIKKAKSNNPVFMLDEVDKIGNDFRGDPASALLEVLDPQQNDTFTDHYLSVPFDLSKVLFITTANYMDPIPIALRDRMEVLELSGYTHGEKLAIAKAYLIPRQIDENGLTRKILAFADDALDLIISSYTREAGVRNLEREIGSICRACAALYAAGSKRKFVIHAKDVHQYLGPVRFESEVAQRTSMPGVVTALAFTPTGGEILFVEATKMPGNGNLILTGQVGDVMKESAHAGFSLIRSHSEDWGITDKSLGSLDLHIHVPAGAIPKDGPSAGVAMLIAMLSILTDRPVSHDLAMTGEITLRGLILPVGGVKEKVLAGYRAGIRKILIPARNQKDLIEIPAEVKKRVKFIPVSDIRQALRYVFNAHGDRGVLLGTSKKAKKSAKSRITK